MGCIFPKQIIFDYQIAAISEFGLFCVCRNIFTLTHPKLQISEINLAMCTTRIVKITFEHCISCFIVSG